MTADPLRLLTEMLRRALGRNDIVLVPTTTARDIAGWDSVVQVGLILDLEEAFSVRFSSREIDRIRNVGDFVELIEEKNKARGSAPLP